MNIKNVYILDDRAILYLNGDDAQKFLQNLISNDINKVSDKNTCFTSLLSPQGKFLYEFIIIKHKSGYLIDCEKSQADGLYKQLSTYKLRSKVEILNLSNEFVVAAFSYEKFLNFDEAQDIAGFTLKYREDPILLDPRNKLLGARLVINLEKLYLSLKKLDLHDSKLEEYYLFSHKLGIVPKDLNKLQNKKIILFLSRIHPKKGIDLFNFSFISVVFLIPLIKTRIVQSTFPDRYPILYENKFHVAKVSTAIHSQ